MLRSVATILLLGSGDTAETRRRPYRKVDLQILPVSLARNQVKFSSEPESSRYQELTFASHRSEPAGYSFRAEASPVMTQDEKQCLERLRPEWILDIGGEPCQLITADDRGSSCPLCSSSSSSEHVSAPPALPDPTMPEQDETTESLDFTKSMRAQQLRKRRVGGAGQRGLALFVVTINTTSSSPTTSQPSSASSEIKDMPVFSCHFVKHH